MPDMHLADILNQHILDTSKAWCGDSLVSSTHGTVGNLGGAKVKCIATKCCYSRGRQEAAGGHKVVVA